MIINSNKIFGCTCFYTIHGDLWIIMSIYNGGLNIKTVDICGKDVEINMPSLH